MCKHCIMQVANRRTNVVQIVSKHMTVVHDQFRKEEGKYNTHSTWPRQWHWPAVLKRQVHLLIAIKSLKLCDDKLSVQVDVDFHPFQIPYFLIYYFLMQFLLICTIYVCCALVERKKIVRINVILIFYFNIQFSILSTDSVVRK